MNEISFDASSDENQQQLAALTKAVASGWKVVNAYPDPKDSKILVVELDMQLGQ